VVGHHDGHNGGVRRPLPGNPDGPWGRGGRNGYRHRSFGLLAASLASFIIEKDIDKELDPQLVEIDERLTRIETLLENIQAPTAKAQGVKLESDPDA
jgi:hypothetical protein